LLQEETYLYISEARRVIVPGGKLIFSFLEFGAPHHWNVFEDTVAARKQNASYPLNMFIEQPVIRLWADKLDFKVESIGSCPLGQNLAVLAKI
jgi:SAM-dependent methyltransferase